MRITRLFFIIIFSATSLQLFAQEDLKLKEGDSMRIHPLPKDSLRLNRSSLKQDFAIYSPLSSMRYNADFSTSSDFKSFLNKDLRMSSDFLSPLYNRYLEDQKMSPYMYILGLAQTATAGYLLYEHISKYGVWDRKKK